MQQAMHPELNYNSCFRKKWVKYYKLTRDLYMKCLKTTKEKKWNAYTYKCRCHGRLMCQSKDG